MDCYRHITLRFNERKSTLPIRPHLPATGWLHSRPRTPSYAITFLQSPARRNYLDCAALALNSRAAAKPLWGHDHTWQKALNHRLRTSLRPSSPAAYVLYQCTKLWRHVPSLRIVEIEPRKGRQEIFKQPDKLAPFHIRSECGARRERDPGSAKCCAQHEAKIIRGDLRIDRNIERDTILLEFPAIGGDIRGGAPADAPMANQLARMGGCRARDAR